MAEFPVAPVRKKAKQISDSDDAPVPQAPETRRSHRSDPAQDPAELWDHDVDDADSEKSDGSNDEHDDFEVEDEEDLQHVPASEPAADSDESDAEASATFAALSKAAQRVPLAEQRKKKSTENTASADEPSCLPPRKERGKRDTARDNEKPRFIDTAMSTKPQGSGKLHDNSSAPKVKQEPVEPTVRRQHVGKERQSSPDIISISDSDDDGIQVVDSSSIEIVFRPEDGKVTLKMQHSRVERTVQLGIDFYLGYYLFKIAFPGTEQKNIFAKDALSNSAFTLRLLDVMERIKTDTTYRNLLTPLLHGRASSFRLKAKNASDATVMANYALQGNAEARTGFLITGMRYIYPLSPGPVDPRTGKRGVLHPALTSSRIPLRAHDPSRPSVPPPLLFRIRRYTRSRYADLRLIHAAAARHAPAPTVLPLSLLAVLLLRHFTYSIFFPISGLIRSGCPPSPSRCRPLPVLQCGDPLTVPRHLSSCSSCLGVPVPTCVGPHFGCPHRLARGRALHDLREVSHRTRMISSPSLLTHSSDPFPPRPFPRLSFCTRLLVSLSPS
ncbi:hypothetical protein DFH08DRAFT_1090378 [Mycena albidolilacea]|uniref:DUF6532 domain-containing protein n=1 Tax=Mycena albidolilacea TaxID=1033008 RepID=A0AAD6YXF8_9AGAR|nr:hypothetical protein DFH08DRAFT_1090378 [Mycena albidolilacea]